MSPLPLGRRDRLPMFLAIVLIFAVLPTHGYAQTGDSASAAPSDAATLVVIAVLVSVMVAATLVVIAVLVSVMVAAMYYPFKKLILWRQKIDRPVLVQKIQNEGITIETADTNVRKPRGTPASAGSRSARSRPPP